MLTKIRFPSHRHGSDPVWLTSLRTKRSRANEVLCVAYEDSGRAKIGARAKKGKEKGGVGQRGMNYY